MLVARAAEARSLLPDALRERGAEVDEVALYETVAEPLGDGEARRSSAPPTSRSPPARPCAFCSTRGAAAGGRAHRLDRPDHERNRPGARPDRGRGSGAPRRGWPGGGADGRRRGTPGARMIVTLLTDYGRDDDFVGVCHGVIRRFIRRSTSSTSRTASAIRGAPGRARPAQHAPLHARGRARGRGGPPGGHRAPGDRAAHRDGRILVGPDNGLLSLAWSAARGSISSWTSRARRTASSRSRPPSTAATYSPRSAHGSRAARSWPTR